MRKENQFIKAGKSPKICSRQAEYSKPMAWCCGSSLSVDLKNKRANNVFPVRRRGSTRPKSWCFSSVWKQEKIMSQLKAVRQEEIPQKGQPFVLFGPSTDWWDLPTLGRAICFTKSTNSSVNLTQKHPTDTPSTMFDQMSSQVDT